MKWLPFINPFFLAFWLLPPILIFLAIKKEKRKYLLYFFIAYVFFGWLCVNLGIWLYYESLGWLINSTRNPPQDWLDAWSSDRAKRAFGLFFGWIYAIIYYMLWFVPVWIVKFIVGMIQKITLKFKKHVEQ